MKTNYVLVLALGSAVCLVPATFAKPGGGNGASERAGGGANNSSLSRPSTPAVERAPAADRVPSAERVAPAPRSAKPAAQELSASMHDINQTAFAQRRGVLDSVDMRLQSSRDALKQIQRDAKQSRADARADFKAALDDVKAREKDLDSAVKASRKADEGTWETRRAELAQKAQAHADAVARLEKIRLAPPNPLPTP